MPRPKSRQLTKRTYQEFAPPPTKTAGKNSRMEPIFSGIVDYFSDSAKNITECGPNENRQITKRQYSILGKASYSVIGAGNSEYKKQEAKIDNFTQKVLGIWKILPIFASYRSALWKKTLNCLKS